MELAFPGFKGSGRSVGGRCQKTDILWLLDVAFRGDLQGLPSSGRRENFREDFPASPGQ